MPSRAIKNNKTPTFPANFYRILQKKPRKSPLYFNYENIKSMPKTKSQNLFTVKKKKKLTSWQNILRSTTQLYRKTSKNFYFRGTLTKKSPKDQAREKKTFADDAEKL